MTYLKAAIAGIVGSLVMFIIMIVGIHVTGFAPFNIPPSAAFLVKLGLPTKPLALLIHFGYGAFWSIVLILVSQQRPSIPKGLLLALALWLVMMIVYSPIIGWGFFGFGDTSDLPEKLQLGLGIKFLVMTLALHLIYGALIGWLNAVWVANDETAASA